MYQVEIGEYIDLIVEKKIGADFLPLFNNSVIFVIKNQFPNVDLDFQILSHLE